MTMRRISGWWRLWFAISGIWAALAIGIGVTVVVGAQSAADRMKFHVEIACFEPTQGGRFGGIPVEPEYASSATGPWTKYQKTLVGEVVKSRTMKLSELNSIDRCNKAKHRDYVGEVAKERMDAIAGTILGAVSLPFIILILGSLTGWIVRGFRADKSER